jgi:chloramphenicol O-acetyltransferase type B
MRAVLKFILALPWKILNMRFSQNFTEFPHINAPCKFTRNTFIGKNCHFNGMAIDGKGKVSIGDNFHSGKQCLIITDIHDYDHGEALPYGKGVISRSVIIERNVWIGTRVIILGGVTLGEGCIIQAGAVVTNNIPPLAIAGGSPAKVFKSRNSSHYSALISLARPES